MLKIAKGGIFCFFIAVIGFLWYDHNIFIQLQQQNQIKEITSKEKEYKKIESVEPTQSYISYKVQSLEQFISHSLSDYESPKGIIVPEESSKFKYITLNNVRFSDEDSLDLAAQYIKQKKIKKMQKLATYISHEYNVSLENAEQIVLNSFVESDKHRIEPLLVLSVIGVESTYQQYTKSHMGAIGLTQVIPTYHKAKVQQLKAQNLDIWSVQGNIKLGTQILREYIDLAKGNVQNGLQMYNGSLHDSSKKYSRKVLNKMTKLNNVVAQL